MSELSDAVAAIANDVSELQTATQRVLDLLASPTLTCPLRLPHFRMPMRALMRFETR